MSLDCVACGESFNDSEIGRNLHLTGMGHEPFVYRRTRNRPTISKTARRNVFLRDNFTCRWCGWRDHNWQPNGPKRTRAEGNYLTLDHLVALSLGGTNLQSNLITLCCDCNERKGQVEAARLQQIIAHLRQSDPGVLYAAFKTEEAS